MMPGTVHTISGPDVVANNIPQRHTQTSSISSQSRNPNDGSDEGITKRANFRSTTLEIVANNKGLLLVAASQFFFSLMNLSVKKLNSLNPPVPALELVAAGMSITWTFCIIYMLVTKVPDPFLGPKGIRILLFARGFSGFIALFGMYYSLQYLSLSDATVLSFLSPLTTAIAGALLLKESFTRKEAFAGIFSLLGVVLIARPTFIFGSASLHLVPEIGTGTGIEKGTPAQRLVAVGVALMGVLGATGAYVSLRAIGKQAHALHSLVSFSTICVVAAPIGMLGLRMPAVIPTHEEFLVLLIMVGIFGFMAQALLTLGLQRETAGRGTMAVYIQIIFATILERIFFHSVPSVLSVIGTVMIMTSAIYVALTKANTSGIPAGKRGAITLDGPEDAAMEEGLLGGLPVDSGVSNTCNPKLEASKSATGKTGESVLDNDLEAIHTGKVPESSLVDATA